MIKDTIRTESYQTAINNNCDVFKNKIVLDVGCGTGILSIFAARAGAKHVYGVDNADIADYAKEIIKENNLSDQITIIKGKIEEINLPANKVDIIISEWMGYFLLYESMLDTVIYARDKWLVNDGLILPDHAIINIAAIEDEEYKHSKIHFWDDVYGIKMKCIKRQAVKEPLIDNCEKTAVNSSICRIYDIDLYTVKKEDLEFSSPYELIIKRDDTVHGLVAWFDIFFEKLPNIVKFSTGPFSELTHWKQTVFYTKEDIKVAKGERLKGSIAVRKALKNFRNLDVKISYHFQGKYDKKNFVQLYKIQ